MDFTIDAIDDLRLVVDEACGQVLELSAGATVLTLTIGFLEDALKLKVSSDGTLNQVPDNIQDSMAWTILSALSDSVSIEDGGLPAVLLTKSNRRVS